jgi:hypothetical protein
MTSHCPLRPALKLLVIVALLLSGCASDRMNRQLAAAKHAQQQTDDPRFKFDQDSAQKVFGSLRNTALHLDSTAQAGLEELKSHRNSEKYDHTQIQSSLTDAFTAGLSSDPSSHVTDNGWTFCPPGSEFAPAKNTEDVRGWTECRQDGQFVSPIWIPQVWVSNDKEPLLTLLVVSSNNRKNVDIPLVQLRDGSYSFDRFFKEFYLIDSVEKK